MSLPIRNLQLCSPPSPTTQAAERHKRQLDDKVIQACCSSCSVLTAVLCGSIGTSRWSCLVASPLSVWLWSWARSFPHLLISSWHTAACVHSVWEVGIRHACTHKIEWSTHIFHRLCFFLKKSTFIYWLKWPFLFQELICPIKHWAFIYHLSFQNV